jgi:hypothetical protein
MSESTANGDDLPNGHPLTVRFRSELSRTYCEPLGDLYSADGQQRLVFSSSRAPYEAYGYVPGGRPGTPRELWSDRHMLDEESRGAARTPWGRVKELVNREIFLESVRGQAVEARLQWTKSHDPKFICPRYHRHLHDAYQAVKAIKASIIAHANTNGVSVRDLMVSDAVAEAI